VPVERLQKILAQAGHGSRRSAERLIVDGRVTVNGAPAELGQRADPAVDRIEVDRRPIATAPASTTTILLHKPVGYVVTASDERGRRTVYDLLPDAPAGLRYAGRLDRDTSGLLLLTTDGRLAFRLTHPRYEVAKAYEAETDADLDDRSLDRLRRGVRLDDGVTAPARVERLRAPEGRHRFRVTIHEGRNRQVRRMFEAVGRRVVRLHRVAVGPVRLGSLARGASRPLTDSEQRALRRLVGLERA
jgi:23S rRNA pseudouridine2605 synthase